MAVRDWRRRVDPAFYFKEPRLLRAQAQVPRYSDEAQAHVRSRVLADDGVLHIMAAITGPAAYVAVTGAGVLDVHGNAPTLWALAVLAVAAPRATPWWPPSSNIAMLAQALLGSALIAIPGLWRSIDTMLLGTALLVAVTLFVARASLRIVFVGIAVGLLLAERVPGHTLVGAVLVGVLAAGATVRGCGALATAARLRPQLMTWSAFAALLFVCAYALAFHATALERRVSTEIGAMALAYLCVCTIAVRIRRAEFIARPNGVLSLPQTIVPLLDRSHDHAVICWLA